MKKVFTGIGLMLFAIFSLSGCGTKEILDRLNIKENTLKYHNKNIYAKLGITSRKQLVAVYKQLCITQQLSDE